jgi:hypothetical protein
MSQHTKAGFNRRGELRAVGEELLPELALRWSWGKEWDLCPVSTKCERLAPP